MRTILKITSLALRLVRHSAKCVGGSFSLVGCFLWLIFSANFANAEEKAVKRWAIISSKDNESQKLADLLFAELVNDTGMELVERDKLAEISTEQELGNLSNAVNSNQRLKLLNLIKADRLSILSVDSLKKTPVVRMVISESGQGARLKVLRFPFNDESEAVKMLVSEIRKCRKKYADGIKKIVAVAPLLPKNISHKYDSLGIIYEELLESELILVPGVAVLEITEARKIAEELANSGNDLQQRIVPILINGDYEILEDKNEIYLELYARQKSKVLASVKKTIKQKDIVSFFKKIIANTVLSKDTGKETFSLDEQYKWLISQAENASQLALPENAIGLREAALMLKPDNAKERLSLLQDYYNFYEYQYNIPKGTKASVKKQIFTELASGRVSAYIRATHHIEFLVRNKMINRESAAKLIGKHRVRKLGSVFPGFYIKNKEGEEVEVFNDKIKDKAVDAQFEMDKSILPLLCELSLPKPNYGTGLSNLQQYVKDSYLHRFNNSKRGAITVEKCLYYFNEIMPENFRTSFSLESFFHRKIPEQDDFSVITTAEWLAFLGKLLKSKKLICKSLAEFGFISSEMWSFKKFDPKQKKNLVNRIVKLLHQWGTLPQKDHYDYRKKEPIYDSLKRFYAKLTEEEFEKKIAKTKKRKVKPSDWQTNPSTWSYWGFPKMLGYLRFKEIKINYPKQHYEYKMRDFRYLGRINNFDALYNRNGIWTLDKNGNIQSLIKLKKGNIRDAFWDGLNIWICRNIDHNKDSLAVYDISGEKIAYLSETKIPNHSWSMQMAIAEQGKLFIVGCLRPHYRVWMGMVTLSKGKLQLKEIHRARKMPTKADQGDYWKEKNMVFRPSFIHLVKMPNEKNDFILVDREGSHSKQRYTAPPLVINKNTNEVAVLSMNYTFQGGNNCMSSKNGVIFHPGGIDIVKLPNKWENWKKFKRKRYGEWTPGSLTGEIDNSFYEGTVFMDDNYLYAFARKCYRIDLKTLKEEDLIRGSLPRKYQMDWIRKSKNHGLLGFKDEKFHTISIDKKHIWFPKKANK